MKTIISGPWESVYNASDESEAYKTKLYSASNCYRPKGVNSFAMRPPFVVKQAAGTLGTVTGRVGQGGFEHVGLDGTSYRFVFCGGKVYRWDGNTTFTDVTPGTVTINSSARVFCATFGDNLVVHDQINKPWYVPTSGLTATPLVATNIQVNTAGHAWRVTGPMAVYDGRLFFALNSVNGFQVRDTIVWSEVASVAVGYEQDNYANYWELFQTDTRPIYGIAATESSLVVLRAQSILNITGKTEGAFQTNATKESVEGVGTTSPNSLVVHDGFVWFLDEQGRQYRYRPGETPEPLWTQMADTVAAALRQGFATTATGCAQAVFHPDLNLVLVASYSSTTSIGVPSTLHAFDAVSGLYYGTWDIDGAKLIHTMWASRDNDGRLSLCVLGENSTISTIATEGQVWRQYTVGEMTGSTSWADPGGPSASVTTHHLGRNEEGDWNFDRLLLRAVTSSANAAGRTMPLTYYTSRQSGTPSAAVLGQPPAHPISGATTGYQGEAVAVWGLGPNARGPWLMAKLSCPTATQTVQPFTPTAVELRGRLVPANPYIGTGAPSPITVPAGAYVSDTFTRADSSSVLGNADTGQTWVQAVGVWGIASSRAYMSTAVAGIAVIESSHADATVSAVVGTSTVDFGLYFRYVDVNNWWRFVFSSGQWFLQKNVAGSTTTVSNPVATLTASDTIAVVLSGSSITCKQNGVSVATTSDSQFSTATLHGMGTAAASLTQRWDTFLVTA
jgi:hypothetical protein